MISIVTDSSSDLPPDLAAAHGITVVPLTVRFGDEEFVDGRDLDSDGFWQRLSESPTLPETAAPSPGAFYQAFIDAAASGAEGVVAVCLSGALSATYQSAVIAGEKAAGKIPVRVIDSRAVSMALGFQALAAAGARSGGLDEATAAAAQAVPRTNLVAALDTLEFLRRGAGLVAPRQRSGDCWTSSRSSP